MSTHVAATIVEIISAPAIVFGLVGLLFGFGGAFRARRRQEVINLWRRSAAAMIDDPSLVSEVVEISRRRYGIGLRFRNGEPAGESRAIAHFTRGLDLSEDDVATKLKGGYQVAYLKNASDQAK